MHAPFLLAGLSVLVAAPAPKTSEELTLERVFRARPYQGQAARDMGFSPSGRFLAFLWNPFGVPGTDLYVHDGTTGQLVRVTSPELMRAYDAPEDLDRFARKLALRDQQEREQQEQWEAQRDYIAGAQVDLGRWEKAQLELVKKEAAEKKAKEDAAKGSEGGEKGQEAPGKAQGEPPEGGPRREAKKAADKEEWQWRDELKKKLEKDKVKPRDLYPGVADLCWAHRADELIFQYRGDLFRYLPADKRIVRLTMTDRPERMVAYTPTDDGFFYMDETRVYRARFGQEAVLQVNRELTFPDDADKKYRIATTSVSEDGQWTAITARALPPGAEAPGPRPGREVQIMDYSKRFAEGKRVPREVQDDKRNVPAMALYVRPVPAGEAPGKQPEPVFTHPGGDTWFYMSPAAWSREGGRYTFSTWDREKEQLRIYVGRAEGGAKPEVILERNKGEVSLELAHLVAPRFTPDGKTLVAILDQGSHRQPFAIDLATKAARPLVQGAFECHPVHGITDDSRTLFVGADREDPAMANIYAVDLETGKMSPVGKPGGMHRATAISRDGRQMASMFGNWRNRPELYRFDLGKGTSKALTDSHDPAWDQLGLLMPELFTFTNRHGDRLSGMVFKPKGWKPSNKRPGVVYLYGGPLGASHVVETDTFHRSAFRFSAYMAAKHGYVMTVVDTRGLSNYARRLAEANWENPGRFQTEDLEDLAKHLQHGFGVDTRRLGLHGWSFGGFQTQMTLYTSPDTFACGIAGAGPTEWENYYAEYTGRAIGKLDHTKPNLRKFSLLPLARGLKKPLLLCHGMMDDNVLFQDTVNVLRVLMESGKEGLVELFLDPDGVHHLGGAVQEKGWLHRYETFFLQHLGRSK